MIDKGIYQTSEATAPIKEANEDVQVEIVADDIEDAVEMADAVIDSLKKNDFSKNLAETIDDDTLNYLSSELMNSYEGD